MIFLNFLSTWMFYLIMFINKTNSIKEFSIKLIIFIIYYLFIMKYGIKFIYVVGESKKKIYLLVISQIFCILFVSVTRGYNFVLYLILFVITSLIFMKILGHHMIVVFSFIFITKKVLNKLDILGQSDEEYHNIKKYIDKYDRQKRIDEIYKYTEKERDDSVTMASVLKHGKDSFLLVSKYFKEVNDKIQEVLILHELGHCYSKFTFLSRFIPLFVSIMIFFLYWEVNLILIKFIEPNNAFFNINFLLFTFHLSIIIINTINNFCITKEELNANKFIYENYKVQGNLAFVYIYHFIEPEYKNNNMNNILQYFFFNYPNSYVTERHYLKYNKNQEQNYINIRNKYLKLKRKNENKSLKYLNHLELFL